MRVKSFYRMLRIIATVTLFFFSWSFMPLWQAVAYAAESRKASGVKSEGATRTTESRSQTTGDRFEKALEAIQENINKTNDKADKSEDDAVEREALKTKMVELALLDAELKKQFSDTEKLLKDKGLSKTILDRHAAFVKNYTDNYTQLKSEIDDSDKAKTKADRKAKIEKARLHLEKTQPVKKHNTLKTNRLPSRTRELKPIQTSWLDKAMNWLIPTAEASENPPTAADLAETLDAPQTQEISDLAQKLGGTSVSLYEYVRNAFTYEPYAASTKGTIQTLREKSGNEWDLASTLISLCRASGIPARYVVGTVEIPIDRAMQWLGVEDSRMAGNLLATFGRPTSLVISGGKITAIRTQQVWVRAYVPFLISRGATTGTGDTWVDLDPSFKEMTTTKTLTLTNVPVFDQSNYLSTFRTESPFEYYRTQLQVFLDANAPGYVPEALAQERELVQERFGILIGQVPYTIKSIVGTYSEVPDAFRQKFKLSITDPSTGESQLSYTASIPQIIGKRLTLSYSPATTSDATIIATYGGLYATPAYLVQLVPQIKLDGVVVAQGSSIGAGQEQSMVFDFDTTIDTDRVENTITAGGYYAIGLSARSGDTRENILERTNQLAALAGTIDFNDSSTLDQKLGEILYLSAAVYNQNVDAITKQIAALNGIVDVRDVSEMMYFLNLKVETLFGIPKKITSIGITGDMDRNIHAAVPTDGDMTRVKPFMQLMCTQSSYLEHDVTEKIYQTQALSAVKGIQLAHDQGIPVHTINGQNIATELPMLQLSSEDTADISNAVNAGQEVIVPERSLTLGIWSGIGYIVQDPTSGKGAYLISGGYGGVAAVGNAIIEDMARATMADFASWLGSSSFRREVRFPGKDNFMNTHDDTIYHEVSLTTDGGELQEDAGCRDASNCLWKYGISHLDYGQALIMISENGADAYLSKHIKARDWQSQDGAPYLRAGTAIVLAIEYILNVFSPNNPDALDHGISGGGSGYRTRMRNQQLIDSGNSRPSQTSHHMDGVAADIILVSTDVLAVKTPKKCEVLQEAAYIVQGNGEVKHENTATSVHVAVPGKTSFDYDLYSWSCQ